MKEHDSSECKVHVLVCTNEKAPGKPCCKPVGGQELYFKLKEKLKAEKLYDTHWITRTGCLDHCNLVGPTVVIQRPGGKDEWYSEVTEADFDKIWNKITRPVE
jgi:(2Fe-2S) ferredoxin